MSNLPALWQQILWHSHIDLPLIGWHRFHLLKHCHYWGCTLNPSLLGTLFLMLKRAFLRSRLSWQLLKWMPLVRNHKAGSKTTLSVVLEFAGLCSLQTAAALSVLNLADLTLNMLLSKIRARLPNFFSSFNWKRRKIQIGSQTEVTMDWNLWQITLLRASAV